MVKKIAYLLVVCMIFGTVATMVSCNDADVNANETTAVVDGSDSDSVSESDSDGMSDESSSESDTQSSSEPEEIRSVDLYIIAGQSNGAGYTKIDEPKLLSLWSSYKTGSENVLYRGSAEYTNNVNTPQVSTGVNYVKYWTNAKAGQGRSTSHMGAEVGMAAKLSSTYYQDDKVCGIVKYAHGGTSLFNSTSGENAANGNWVSPSYASARSWSYSNSGLTGRLYRNLLKEVEDSVEKLEKRGYNDINIKGIFWMQGESDRGNPSEYETALKYFITDIRRDLGEIMGEDLSDLAFMIGEISRTSGSASAGTVTTNETFIAKQREIASEMANVYTIASGQYEINWLDGSGNNTNGQDAWHWTTEPMFRIGELIAQCILDNILKVK
ncbi:MAG: sialate O-acetylesterase [Ruminococcaceae bacterium]|nr:sialate O-acetylesterase [Oscillospiraceae bacterium]